MVNYLQLGHTIDKYIYIILVIIVYKQNVLNIMLLLLILIFLRILVYSKVIVKPMNYYFLILVMENNKPVEHLRIKMKNGQVGHVLLDGLYKVYGHHVVMVLILIQ